MILLWQTANMSDDKCVKYVVVEEMITHVAKNAYDDELRLFIHLLFKPTNVRSSRVDNSIFKIERVPKFILFTPSPTRQLFLFHRVRPNLCIFT